MGGFKAECPIIEIGLCIVYMDEHYMKLALAEAVKARDQQEVPVGAVLVSATGEILAAAHNLSIASCDPSAHAEILALRTAGRKLGNYRLPHTVLYVTIEPCIMCMGAIIHARVKKVVFGTQDPRWGAAGSLYNFESNKMLNHHPTVVSGVCEAECREIIRRFFKNKRKASPEATG